MYTLSLTLSNAKQLPNVRQSSVTTTCIHVSIRLCRIQYIYNMRHTLTWLLPLNLVHIGSQYDSEFCELRVFFLF
jgi:hypothetical protein